MLCADIKSTNDEFFTTPQSLRDSSPDKGSQVLFFDDLALCDAQRQCFLRREGLFVRIALRRRHLRCAQHSGNVFSGVQVVQQNSSATPPFALCDAQRQCFLRRQGLFVRIALRRRHLRCAEHSGNVFSGARFVRQNKSASAVKTL